MCAEEPVSGNGHRYAGDGHGYGNFIVVFILQPRVRAGKRPSQGKKMTIDENLLKILVCPETKTAVAPVDLEMLSDLNSKIEAGSLKNKAGNVITEKMDGGLIRDDKQVLYPIRNGIPIMLIDERIEF